MITTADEHAARYVHDHLRMRNASLLPFDDLPYRDAVDLIRKVAAGEYRGGFGALLIGDSYPQRIPEEVVLAGRLVKQRWPVSLPFASRDGAKKILLSNAPVQEAHDLVAHLGVEVERDLS